MKTQIITDNHIYDAEIKRCKNKLIIEFDNEYNVVPYPIISKCKFTVHIQPTEEEIDCGDCDTCLTPIC